MVLPGESPPLGPHGVSVQGSHHTDTAACGQHASSQLKPISILQVQPQSRLDVIYVHGSLQGRPHTKIPAVCAAGGGHGPHCPGVEPDLSFGGLTRAKDAGTP